MCTKHQENGMRISEILAYHMSTSLKESEISSLTFYPIIGGETFTVTVSKD